MSKVKILIPESPVLATVQIPVRITDLNYGGHLGNDAIVSVIQEARVQFLSENNMTELDAGGVGLIQSDLSVNYKNEGFYGDILQIEIFCDLVSKISFELIYRITTQREDKNILIALCSTTLVGFDYAQKKVCPLTSKLLQSLGKTI